MATTPMKPTTFAAKVADLAAKGLHYSLSRMSGPTAPDDVVRQRREQCSSCPARAVEPRGEFCGDCGCPRTKTAELSTKLRFGYCRCPRRRPGFTNEATNP